MDRTSAKKVAADARFVHSTSWIWARLEMASVMRVASALLFVLCTGCASAPVPPSTTARHSSPTATHHYTKARALQLSLGSRSTGGLLKEGASEQVLELAHAQTCLARYTRSDVLAAETVAMLDQYVELHRAHGSEPNPRFQRRARQLTRDAVNAGSGTASPYALGCTVDEPRDRSHAWAYGRAPDAAGLLRHLGTSVPVPPVGPRRGDSLTGLGALRRFGRS